MADVLDVLMKRIINKIKSILIIKIKLIFWLQRSHQTGAGESENARRSFNHN